MEQIEFRPSCACSVRFALRFGRELSTAAVKFRNNTKAFENRGMLSRAENGCSARNFPLAS